MSLRQESYVWFEPRTVVVAIIATAAVWSTSIVVGGWRSTHASDTPHTLAVSGQASHRVTPDRATWTVTVHGRSDDRDSAVQQQREAIAAARTYLLAQGITDAELNIKPSVLVHDDSVVTGGGDQPQEVSSSYDSKQEIEIASPDIARVMRVYHEAQLSDDLADADVAEPICAIPNRAALEQQLLGEARRDARAKAESAVHDFGGGHLGRLVEADLGNVDSDDGCAAGDLTATASATYELE
jgi:uncharacterized protein YggE